MRLTVQEYEQGWYALGCGKHAKVFRGDVMQKLKDEDFEECTCLKEPQRAVKIEKLKVLKEKD